MNKIIYLDAAASSLKPDSVIDAESDFLRNKYANSGRGVCSRTAWVDEMVSNARAAVGDFINAKPQQIVFTSGATDGLNRVRNILKDVPHPVVAVSDLDHHSARLPWMDAHLAGVADLTVMSLDSQYNIDVSRIPRADIMVITAMSNVIGVTQDVSEIVRAAREKNPNVITIVDAAQYAAHASVDVCAWDCDFMCFSGHKIGADTGIGVMYIKNPEKYLPDKFGGGMVSRVMDDEIIFSAPPEKFEAGTLPLTQIVGMPFAIDNIKSNPADSNLVKYMYDRLAKMPRVKILTRPDAALISFVVDGMHVLDFGALAGAHGVCLRVGNMCATWIHRALGVDGSIRISPGFWNTIDDMRRTADIIENMVK